MDRFKFRVWDKKLKIFLKDCFINECGNLHFENKEGTIRVNSKSFLIEQCTGLKDKNGRLVYENDIVKVDGFINNEEYHIGFIYHDKSCFRTRINIPQPKNPFWGGVLLSASNHEVIGNIHENKDLLDNK